MAKHTLRPYQTRAVDKIQALFELNIRKVLLHLETGGGKTTVFCDILKKVAAKKKKAIMVVHGRKLVNQASNRLMREGVYHGVLMAGHYLKRPSANIQICSIDTLLARDSFPEADLVVIDEAHMAVSDGWHHFIEHYPNSFLLPVTATPYTDKSLRHIADVIVRPTSFDELVADGYLVPPRYFAPHIPDLKGIKTTKTAEGTDYAKKQLTEALDRNDLIGDILVQWEKLGEYRPTITYAISVNHSKHICETFNRRGIRSAHVDAHTPENQREDLIGELEMGRLKNLCNVGILCTGVDIPPASCGIMARPTKSFNLYCQQAGRFTRPYPGKDDFILLDHAGNIIRHGFINQLREANLDEVKGRNAFVPSVHYCKNCMIPFEKFCPACGFVPAQKESAIGARDVVVTTGELKELDGETPEMVKDRLVRHARRKKYAKAWVRFKLIDIYGTEKAYELMPARSRRRKGYFVSKEDLTNVRF